MPYHPTLTKSSSSFILLNKDCTVFIILQCHLKMRSDIKQQFTTTVCAVYSNSVGPYDSSPDYYTILSAMRYSCRWLILD